jgi:Lipoprotein confined to pathogenic Mycobacterium
VTNRSGHAVLVTRGLSSLVAVAALLAVACTIRGQAPSSTMSPNPNQQFQELMTRPDIEQISQRYEQMANTIRDRLVADTGLPPWQVRSDTGGSSGCRNYPDVSIPDAQSRGLPLWAAEANLPDDKWPRAVQIVTDIAKENGFGPPKTLVDVPGRHEVSLEDGYGAEITFGTRVHTSMLIQTGCHLTAEAHKRGKPSGGP